MSLCDDHKNIYEHAPVIYELLKGSGEGIAKDLHVAAALLSLPTPPSAVLRFLSNLVLRDTLNFAADSKSNCHKKESEGYIRKISPEHRNSREKCLTRVFLVFAGLFAEIVILYVHCAFYARPIKHFIDTTGAPLQTNFENRSIKHR